MNYIEYYNYCLAGKPAQVDMNKFTYEVHKYRFPTEDIHKELFKDIDNIEAVDWIKKVPYKREYLDLLKPTLDILLMFLESNYYGCSVFIDKIFIYRSVPFDKRTSSAIYHYDNTPPTQLKTIIYLNDVLDDSDGPIEFCENLVKEPTRRGPKEWGPPPNNSRLTDEEVSQYNKVKIFGKAGTTTTFYPSCVHRANPPHVGKVRDVINVLTQPTDNPLDKYKYISGFESSGTPLMDPKDRRHATV